MKVHLGYFLTLTARRSPEQVALMSEGTKITYEELNRQVNRLSHGLIELGLRAGDKVATLFPNSPELVMAYFAILKAGGVLVPLNPRLRPEDFLHMLEHSDSRFLVYSHGFREAIAPIRERLPKIERTVFFGQDVPPESVSFHELIARGKEDEPKVDLGEDDDFCLMYTAGTTGRPKGVLVTHRNFIWGMLNQATSYLPVPDRVLQVFPLSHNAGMIGLMTRTMRGDTMVIIRAPEPELILRTIQEHAITMLGLVPTLSNTLSQVPSLERYDRGSVRLVGSGAAVLPPDTKRRMRELFPNAGIFDTYGMTECSGPITSLRPEDAFRKEGCVGKAFPYHEVRVVDESGRDVSAGEVGEIIVRGPTVMKCYYKDPDATSETIRDGWLYTGDLARVDEEGYLYVVDRKKDLIITGGYNVYPKEVEDVLFAHPKVMEASVIGVPDPKWGETIRAVVVPKKGQVITEQEILDFCRERLASYKKPTSVVFVEDLPKSAVGKVLKRVLRERAGGQQR